MFEILYGSFFLLDILLYFLKLSFQEWTQQVQDMLNVKRFADIAFRDKDFKNAVDYYSKVFLTFISLEFWFSCWCFPRGVFLDNY